MAEKKTVKDLLEDEVKDLYSAEKQLTKAIRRWPKVRMMPHLRRHSRITSRRPKGKWPG